MPRRILTRGDPDPNARGHRDHRRASAFVIAITSAGSAAPVTVIRAPPANAISIRASLPAAADTLAAGLVSGPAIDTAANLAQSGSFAKPSSAWNRLRHEK